MCNVWVNFSFAQILSQSGVFESALSHQFKGAVFQVASQFNMLEMVSPRRTPEDGVTDYAYDRTQGPVCAMVAGAGTIYRNYLAPCEGGIGQTTDRQLNGIKLLGQQMALDIGIHETELWAIQNGYLLPSSAQLDRIDAYLRKCSEEALDCLRGLLCIGLHRDVELTDKEAQTNTYVIQAYCSAVPVGYSQHPKKKWERLARLILGAAYESTLAAAAAHGNKRVFLTMIGGGVFGNDRVWILDAIERAIAIHQAYDLDIRIVSYSPPTDDLRALQARWN